MADDTPKQPLGPKQFLRFTFYVAIIALCIGVIFYLLLNARPREIPKIKEAAPKSILVRPSPAFVSAPGRLRS